jgi:hypothetical protein
VKHGYNNNKLQDIYNNNHTLTIYKTDDDLLQKCSVDNYTTMIVNEVHTATLGQVLLDIQ